MAVTADTTVYETSYGGPISLAVAPVIRAVGVESGLVITPGTANNTFDVSAGVIIDPDMTGANATTARVAIAASTANTITRPAADGASYAISYDTSGTIAITKGTDGVPVATFGSAAGEIPLIPVTSVLIGVIQVTGTAAAVILTSEILQTPNSTRERFNFPVFVAPASNLAYTRRGEIQFTAARVACHTGDVAGRVKITASTANLTELLWVSDATPSTTSASVSSTSTFNGIRNSVTTSVGQFTANIAYIENFNDDVYNANEKQVWVYAFNDQNSGVYRAENGFCTISDTMTGQTGDMTGTLTLSPQQAGIRVTA